MKLRERKHEIPFLYTISIGATVNFLNSAAMMETCLGQSKAHLLRNIKESLFKVCFSQKSLGPLHQPP